MTGIELYEFYQTLQENRGNYLPEWFAMPRTERIVWDTMAELLAPEMSDKAKEMMK